MGTEGLFAAALAEHEGGRLAAAEAGYRAVLAQEPAHPQANNNLAVMLRQSRRWGEAAACLRTAVAGWPEDAGVRSNLACTLGEQGRLAEATAALQVALALKPDAPGSWFNLGNLLKSARSPEGARAAYRRAILLDPEMGGALSNLGDLLREEGALTQAVESYLAAIRAQPDLPQPFVNLGEALKDQGRITEAIGILQKGLERHPDMALMRSNLLLALHYSPWIPPEVIARAHAHWNERHARPLLDGARRFANDRDPDRRLRVGYVSPDFCHHACAHFIEPLLREHDRGAVEVLCYATGRRRDDMTLRLEALADGWRSLADLDDAAAAALVERDRVDLLIDLAGHTAGGRPLLFARRPAPVQVTWLGYPDTTGMPAVDCRLTDAIADPPGETDGWHAERLVRLPRGFLAFQPPAGAGPVGETPAAANGFVTFGSFNSLAKLTPEVVRVWSALLARMPSARLLLKCHGLEDAAVRDSVRRDFARRGVRPERVELLTPVESAAGHLRAYDRLDVALDPFPYNGTTTTCEALWMGVPVVTLAGRHHVARVGASLLTRCGLDELIGRDEAGYVEAAAALAGDLARLSGLRRGMRARLEGSSLLDHRGFARSVEEACRAMWRGWTSGGRA
ncbi:putative O-linked N-acetylglucosamine transferase (SPINDLY family) [Azospirillum agricola]|uniref:O-linked N-acetylglucosamine transferase, SPINDLY family protein n=1 Tax=Azospirillum agricola TaxID=1720247 RepID=UPI001AEB0983|nr:tetratricopeptide repeat protein [Azospirillum agricola]MBP2228899.1 putative O-linked N-acetylglucosamine transferase (SPINDLY family) [Azospirillum agricola]